ncbi:MAG: hypothetical protein KJ634_05600 [Gammaproteobacteria bacterium]|nr:hypothetical protein [Gammaproteobacteria bacterium]MBU1415079.1 hypothetical protein [Gammaproteobacteria bacterium]
MKTQDLPLRSRHPLLAAGIALLLTTPLAGMAATDLADMPLTNTTSVTVLPNIFFIFDNSGSMTWRYMPDYVDDSYCKRDTSRQDCEEGDPPYYTAGFNGIYYDPTVTYSPPVEASGATKAGWNGWLASSGSWTNVPVDGYNVLSGSTRNLTTQYPERVWCRRYTSWPYSLYDCQSAIDGSNNYTYPDASHQYVSTTFGAPLYYTATVEWCTSGGSPWGTGTCQDRKDSSHPYVKYSNWTRVDIKPTTTFPAKAATRTDCAGATCTYAEEMENFANWYAWYSTRQQMMKTAMSLAFKDVRGTPDDADPLDKNYFHARVGFTTISDSGTTDGNGYLAINDFDSTHKGTFYSRLFNASGNSYTPLRGALSKAGRLYSGVIGTDPMQYSCQRNYTILSTDGYWNTNTETTQNINCREVCGWVYSHRRWVYQCDDVCDTAPDYSAVKIDGSSWIGDMDGAPSGSCTTASVTPVCDDSGTCTVDGVTTLATLPACETRQVGNTLADIAYYYYHTDLRPEAADGSCTRNFCTDNVPVGGTDKKVDDVADWQHMTTFTIGLGVDGTLAYQDGYKTSTSGDYYDIKNSAMTWPDPIANSGDERIDDLWHAAVNGRGTYFRADSPRSLTKGLEKALSEMDVQRGAGASAAASNLQLTTGDNYAFLASYRTVKWDGDIKAYSIDGTTGEVATSESWAAQPLLNDLVTGTCGDTDSRTIYTGATTLKPFTWAELDATEQGYFNNISLSQYADWSVADQTAATGAMLLDFLRGHNRYEDQDRDAAWQTACPTYRRLYRDRDNVLGDFVHAQPIYVGQPDFSYADSGYAAFKTAVRAPRLYAQANDGMLHAFGGTSGAELWAYVPPIVMKDLYHLADTKYPTTHRYYLDGPLSYGDFSDGSSWKTMLIGSLGKGGRGIYALDVSGTDGTYPKVLWNFTADDEVNLGLTYGLPITTKRASDDEWVVLVPSGHNNVPNVPNAGDYPTSDGVGRLFVLKASDGTLLDTISTGAGSTSNPSGLATINNHVTNGNVDNTTHRVYGGDLLGNLWGFDLDTGTAYKIADLGQPIMSAPAISTVNGNTVLFFGTGRYLGQSDLENVGQQSIFAIKDGGPTAAAVTKADLVQQTMSGSRTMTNNSVDWNATAGWYIDLPSGELVNLKAQLYAGVLLVATVAPSATACEPGGSGYLYQFNYRTGSAADNKTDTVVATYYASPIVGFSFIRTVGGAVKVLSTTAAGELDSGTSVADPAGEEGGTRVMWRELIN